MSTQIKFTLFEANGRFGFQVNRLYGARKRDFTAPKSRRSRCFNRRPKGGRYYLDSDNYIRVKYSSNGEMRWWIAN